MHRSEPLTTLVALVLVAGTLRVSAQDTNALPLADIVITGSRTERPREAVPASITTLDATAVRTSAAHNPDELLRTVSGVSVLRSYGMGYGIPGQINIRGVPGIHGVLLLADGTPMNEAATGFLNVNEVPMCAIEKIEIVRGPFSSLYGADAFSGVVQLFTLDPAGPPLLGADVRAGNEDFRQVSGTVRDAVGAVDVVVSAEARAIDNYLAHDTVLESAWDPQQGRYVDTRKPAENFDYADIRALAKLGLDVGDSSRLIVHGRVFDGELGYGQTEFVPYYPVPVDDRSENQTALLGATLTTEQSARLNSRVAASFRQQQRETWGLQPALGVNGLPAFVRSYSRSDAGEWRADGLLSVALGDAHTLTPGVDVARVDARFDPTRDADSGQVLPLAAGTDADATHVGAYLEDVWAITDQLRLTAGLRADSHSGFEDVVSPRGGVVYTLADGTRLHASAGRAYRAPSLLEQYQPDVSFGSVVFKSNPGLAPEYIVSTDAGVERRLSDACVVRLNVFYNDMSDLIATRYAGPVVTFENVDEAWSAGAEAEIEYAFTQRLTGFANATRQESEDRHTELDLAYVPETMFGLGLRGEQRIRRVDVEGSVTEQYAGTRGYVDTASGQWRTLDAYWRTDVALKGSLGNGWWAGVGAQNVTDERYQESATVNPAPGRLWYLEAGVRL